jgi:hypothetical protein
MGTAKSKFSRKSLQCHSRYGRKSCSQSALTLWPIETKLTSCVHAREVQSMNLHENPSNGCRDSPKRGITLRVKCPWLATHRNETCTMCSTRKNSAKYEFSGISLQWKPTYSPKDTLFPKYVPLICDGSLRNIHWVPAWRVRGLHIQNTPSNGNRGTAETAHYSPRNVPWISNRSPPNLQSS